MGGTLSVLGQAVISGVITLALVVPLALILRAL